jgi:hypothetical protein
MIDTRGDQERIAMYVWELIAHRLRTDGWQIWHRWEAGERYVVHLHRPGIAGRVEGPTLTEAFAAAARTARELSGPKLHAENAPHFGPVGVLARVR